MTEWLKSAGAVIPVAEAAKRLGVSQQSLYELKKKFWQPLAGEGARQTAKIQRLKKELAGVTEEHDI